MFRESRYTLVARRIVCVALLTTIFCWSWSSAVAARPATSTE